MTDAEIRALYAKIVAAEGTCPGQAPHPDLTSTERFHGSQCCGGLLIVPLLPGLREPCTREHVETENSYSTNFMMPISHEADGCLGYQAKPLSLETLFLAAQSVGGANMVTMGKLALDSERFSVWIRGRNGTGTTPTEALLRALARVAGVEHD